MRELTWIDLFILFNQVFDVVRHNNVRRIAVGSVSNARVGCHDIHSCRRCDGNVL